MVKNNNGMPQDIKTVLFWGLGIGILGITLLILLIIFGNLSGNYGFARASNQTINETGYEINSSSPDVILGFNFRGYVSLSVDEAWNSSDIENNVQVLLNSSEYTVDTATGLITNATNTVYPVVNLTYTTTFKDSIELDSDALILNYSQSATNTAGQFPVVGTILGIALLLAILIGVLVFAIRKMMGVAGSTGSNAGSNSSKGSFDRGGFR